MLQGLSGAVLGASVLALSLLFSDRTIGAARWPLACLLVAVAMLVLPPLTGPKDGLTTLAITVGLPAALSLGPALWLYVEALTAERPWRLQARHARHAVLPAAGLLVALGFAALPAGRRAAMMLRGEGPVGAWEAGLAIAAFALISIWVVQTGVYLALAARRLVAYRDRLRQVFSSTERRELGWLRGLLAVLAGAWLLAVVGVVSDHAAGVPVIDLEAATAIALVFVWSVALWGLRQRPGFEGHYDAAPVLAASEPADRYARSALAPDRAGRIADKLERAMREQALYLEPDLSLPMLAARVGASPNLVSQTLNEGLGESFFDYVNRWRVEAAKPLLLGGDETVLAIAYAVGFNARSSFYRAFKRMTGTTPTAFRAAGGSPEVSPASAP